MYRELFFCVIYIHTHRARLIVFGSFSASSQTQTERSSQGKGGEMKNPTDVVTFNESSTDIA